MTLERRAGDSADLIPAVADELGCDLIALGWAQELEAGRAEVVRSTLEHSPLPVMLIPVRVQEQLAVSTEGGGA